MTKKKLILCILSILLGAYISIFQSYHYEIRHLAYLGAALYGGGVITLCYSYTKKHPATTKIQKQIYNAVGFVIFMGILLSIALPEAYFETQQLDHYGKRGTATVRFVHPNLRSNGYRSVTISFTYKGKFYQQDIINDELNVGDTVGIIFSTKDPEVVDLVR